MSAFLPPPRSLLWVKPCYEDGKPAIDFGCDCGTACLVILDIAEGMTGTREIPYTCDGCLSTHWLTFNFAEAMPPGTTS